LTLDLVQLCQKAFLRAKNHVETLAIYGVDLGTVIKYFTSTILGYVDLLDLVFKEIVVQKCHKDDLFSGRVCGHREIATY